MTYPLYTHGKSLLWTIAFAVALLIGGHYAVAGDIIGQQQKTDVDAVGIGVGIGKGGNATVIDKSNVSQNTEFEAGRYGYAPSIAVGGYGFGAAIQNCWLVGRGKVGSVGGSVGIASNGVNGGGGLFSYGTNYSLMNVVCENGNRIVMAHALGDTGSEQFFKCQDPLWRMALEHQAPGTCSGVGSLETLAIDPEEDTIESAFTPGTSPEVAATTTPTRVASSATYCEFASSTNDCKN